MTRQHSTQPDPKLDLVLERTIDAARPGLAGLDPARAHQALAYSGALADRPLRRRPAPTRTLPFHDARSPEGEEHTHDCCYLKSSKAAGWSGPTPCCPASNGRRRRRRTGLSPPSSASNPTTRARATRPPPCMARRLAAASTATWVSTTAGARRWTSWWRTPGICSRQAEYRRLRKSPPLEGFSRAARHYPAACANFFRTVMPPGVKYTELLPLVFSSQSDSCMYIKSEGRYPPPTTALIDSVAERVDGFGLDPEHPDLLLGHGLAAHQLVEGNRRDHAGGRIEQQPVIARFVHDLRVVADRAAVHAYRTYAFFLQAAVEITHEEHQVPAIQVLGFSIAP